MNAVAKAVTCPLFIQFTTFWHCPFFGKIFHFLIFLHNIEKQSACQRYLNKNANFYLGKIIFELLRFGSVYQETHPKIFGHGQTRAKSNTSTGATSIRQQDPKTALYAVWRWMITIGKNFCFLLLLSWQHFLIVSSWKNRVCDQELYFFCSQPRRNIIGS